MELDCDIIRNIKRQAYKNGYADGKCERGIKMKMTKEMFGELADAIDDIMSEHSLKIITEHRQNIKFVKNQFIAFCWSMFHASKFGQTHREMYNTLDDSHIETALKRILSDFE